jgi:hypothetical protein
VQKLIEKDLKNSKIFLGFLPTSLTSKLSFTTSELIANPANKLAALKYSRPR